MLCGFATQQVRKIVDQTGKMHGRLAVLGLLDTRCPKTRAALWRCRCSCGNEVVVSGSNLRRTYSCGCLKRELLSAAVKARSQSLSLDSRVPAKVRAILRVMKRNACKRGYEWLLSDAEAAEFMSQPCYLCGTTGGNASKITGNDKVVHGVFSYNGLDRIDNTMGYVNGNVAPCCGTCNVMKMDRSLLEFKSHVLRLAERFTSTS